MKTYFFNVESLSNLDPHSHILAPPSLRTLADCCGQGACAYKVDHQAPCEGCGAMKCFSVTDKREPAEANERQGYDRMDWMGGRRGFHSRLSRIVTVAVKGRGGDGAKETKLLRRNDLCRVLKEY